LISIIIPTHNRAYVISRAIKSALAQTVTDLEVIVVDDASSDDTEKVIKGISDPRIVFIKNKKNMGPSGARNVGIKAARGEFITFLDSDDEWSGIKLEEQLRILEKEPGPVIVLTGMATYDDSLGKTTSEQYFPWSGHVYDKFFMLRVTGSISMLVPKKCFEEVGLFDINLHADETWDMGARLAKKYEFKVVRKPLYIAHLHGQTHQWNGVSRASALPILLAKYADEKKRFRKWGASKRLQLGTLKLIDGHKAEARREFVSSILLYPFFPGAYILFIDSLMGIRKTMAIAKNAWKMPGKSSPIL
jgi:glycosyltransferase involved in cell wall biosynthesis